MSEVEKSIKLQSDELGHLSVASRDIASSISDVAQAAIIAAMSVKQANDRTISNQEYVATATTEINELVSSVRTLKSNFDRVNLGVDKISAMIEAISSIADQTNLLALNATIESARAGEAGKGFAVVASEVKNLAGQTGKATEDIAAQIGAIQERTSGAVDAIRSIVTKVEEMENITGSIAAAVEEQNAATQDISRNIEDVASAVEQVGSNVAFVGQASQNTSRMAGEVLGASSDMNDKSGALGQRIQSFLQSVRSA